MFPFALRLAAPVAAVLVALALAGILIALAGAPVLEAYRRMLIGAFGPRLSITETLTRSAPLILTGLAAAVAFRARLWNIGAEGQFLLGALAAAALGSKLGLALPPILLISGADASPARRRRPPAARPLALRLRFGVDEVVTTLLLNFVALLFVSMMIEGRSRIRSPSAGRNPCRSSPMRCCRSSAALAPACRALDRRRAGARRRLCAGAHRPSAWKAAQVVSIRPPPASPAYRSPACSSPSPACRAAGRARRRHRGDGRRGPRDDRPVARLRLYRHRRRHAGGARPSARSSRRSSSPPCSSAPI